MNIVKGARGQTPGASKTIWPPAPSLLRRMDADEFSEMSAVAELDDAGDLREQRVVLAETDVFARLELRAALPYDDRSGGNQLSAETLDAQPLRIRIAA